MWFFFIGLVLVIIGSVLLAGEVIEIGVPVGLVGFALMVFGMFLGIQEGDITRDIQDMGFRVTDESYLNEEVTIRVLDDDIKYNTYVCKVTPRGGKWVIEDKNDCTPVSGPEAGTLTPKDLGGIG